MAMYLSRRTILAHAAPGSLLPSVFKRKLDFNGLPERMHQNWVSFAPPKLSTALGGVPFTVS